MPFSFFSFLFFPSFSHSTRVMASRCLKRNGEGHIKTGRVPTLFDPRICLVLRAKTQPRQVYEAKDRQSPLLMRITGEKRMKG
ncbi:hypothetical protein BDV36DRAFT_270257, partial [Aspergillus pseudocaelatus]